jgi:beta-mannosidase
MREKQYPEWQVGYSSSEYAAPERRVPATVPGAVQLDWAKAEGWGPHTYADNWKDYGWMEDVYWTYSTRLDLPQAGDGERLFFVCGGVDYRFKVRLDGEVVHDQEGMFTPFEIELTNRAKPTATLEIVVFPAPKREGAPANTRAEADQSCKPAVSYGWDWHPRLVPLGIWEETYLEVRTACHLRDAETSYELSNGMDRADVKLTAQVSGLDEVGGAAELVWTLLDREGREVFEVRGAAAGVETVLSSAVDQPQLWWPNGHGEPVLYESVVQLYVNGALADERHSKVGFRRVKLVMHPGAWRKPDDFPKGRSNPPITLEINGRQIFAKGTNWVNPDIFPGKMTRETYLPLVQLAKEAHMNLFRIWGGGIVNKDSFFDLCDELGIMVWQEFPLACNNYVGTPEYLRVLDQESRSIIRRLRRRACLAMWCGGNELFNSWSGMTEQSLALRLLDRNCYDEDPLTPYIMTSPLMGMAHGNYLFRYHDGRELYEVMPKSAYTAYTEFGVPSPSPADILKSFIPEDQLFPPKPGTVWETHHAFNAWVGDTWLQPGVIEDYFGPSETLEELVERGQLLQSEGYKCIYEEARRQKPVCSMALNWCYNEPWPTAANNSLICYPAVPKPSYYAVQASCRPVLASARIPKYSWKEGEWFTPELWLMNDSPESVPAGRIEAYLVFEGEGVTREERLLLGWDYAELPANENLPGPTVRFQLPNAPAGRMTLVLRVPGRSELDSSYTLLYRPSHAPHVQQAVRTMNI